MVGLRGLALTLTLLSTASAADSEPVAASMKKFDPKTKSGSVIELTEANFDELIQEDVWLLDLYATWCSHCRQLEPVWKQLAAELKNNPDIHVAKVDGPRNRIIMSQLRVDAFPSIFLLRDSRMWPYTGPRNSEAIIQFATAGYKAEEPLRPHRCPNHKIGRIVMKMYSLPNKIKEAYTHLKEEHKWSDLGILIAVLGVPVISGVATICLMDAMYLRKARRGDEDDMYEAPAAPPAAPAPAIR